MTTSADLIQEARRELFSGREETANRLSGAITAGATSLVLKYALGGIKAGTVIAIDLEEIRVWEATDSTQTASVVERGVNGTTAAAHADLAYVAVSPRFSNFRILKALNEEIASLSSPANGLFRVISLNKTYNPAVAGYDLTGVTSIDDVLAVQADSPGAVNDWPLLATASWTLRREASTTDFASGFALISTAGYPGQTLRVTYRTGYGALSLTDMTLDVEATTGLHLEAHDIPPLGAIERLVPFAEIKRNFTEAQGDPRRAQEVPAGARSSSARVPAGLRQRRIAEEASRLARRWPRRSR